MFLKMKVLVYASLLVLLTVAAALPSLTVTHKETGLQFDIPDNWSYDQEGDHFMAKNADESVVLIFSVGKAEDVAALLESIAEELDGIIESPEVDSEPQEEEINGLTQVFIEGTGEYNGENVDFDLTMVFGGQKAMSIVALGDIDSIQETIDAIYNSIRQ